MVDVDGHRLSYVASGTIRTTTLALGDLPGRLKILFDGITEVVARYEPDVASVEIVFVTLNPQSTLLLGQGGARPSPPWWPAEPAVAEYTALQMKKAVVGHGRAAKSQVQEMVRRLLQLPGLPGTDAADGLGPGHYPRPRGCRHGPPGRGRYAEPPPARHVQGRAQLLRG